MAFKLISIVLTDTIVVTDGQTMQSYQLNVLIKRAMKVLDFVLLMGHMIFRKSYYIVIEALDMLYN